MATVVPRQQRPRPASCATPSSQDDCRALDRRPAAANSPNGTSPEAGSSVSFVRHRAILVSDSRSRGAPAVCCPRTRRYLFPVCASLTGTRAYKSVDGIRIARVAATRTTPMKFKSFLLSAAGFVLLAAGVAWIDPRVRDKLTLYFH